jgi:aminoglycoside phosphotransferase (APT) family kinase protein
MTIQPFDELLQHLDTTRPVMPETWRGWRITPVTGGANNLLHRATGEDGDYAVKFTVRDDRDRAGREYAALSALRQAGLSVAPEPIWLERERYRQPVVVQSWLDGETLAGPPQSDAEWAAFLDHYDAVHSVTPQRSTLELASGYVNVSSGEAGQTLVREHAGKLPLDTRPAPLQELLARFDAWSPPKWPAPAQTLVRVDGNWRNFLRCVDGLASVDWEYSGWGDPAFELAELALHPAYAGVPRARWDQLTLDYARRSGDPTAALRIQTYTAIMLVWWVVRWARFLYETPRGLDARLVSRSADWLIEVERQYERYLALAQARAGAPDWTSN